MAESKMAQILGIGILVIVLLISGLLVGITRNAISSSHVSIHTYRRKSMAYYMWLRHFFQNFALHIEKRWTAMKKQQAIRYNFAQKGLLNEIRFTCENYRNKLAFKMLPRSVVSKMADASPDAAFAESFESASILFFSIVDFNAVQRACNPSNTVSFLNGVYQLVDKQLAEFDVLRVETVVDSYLVAAGIPNKSEKHAVEICQTALAIRDAVCPMIDRPDIRNRHIDLTAAVHTGPVVAGVVGSRMPRYCVFGDTVLVASTLKANSMRKLKSGYKEGPTIILISSWKDPHQQGDERGFDRGRRIRDGGEG